jgi:adenylate cyclase class 2
MLEIELKLSARAAEVEDSLRSRGAELRRTETHGDQYYQHPSRDFCASDEALRIRVTPDRAWLTYKGPKIGHSGKVRKELECGVERPEVMTGMLEALGFQKAGMVCKTRGVWSLEGITIAVDRVEGLGEFVELEWMAEDGEKDQALERLRKMAVSLGLSPKEEIRRSYLEMMAEGFTG